MASRAPKQWKLTTRETSNSYTIWKENLIYTLSLDPAFQPFLDDNVTWRTSTDPTPCRGFTDTPATETRPVVTKESKVATLNLMLGQIANFATVISRNQIVKNSTSLHDIWDKIRQHYGFNNTGSRFLDLVNIKLEADERHEDLYQRLVSFFDDNLLTTEGRIIHHSSVVQRDEEISPTLENVVVLMWLQRIHVGLPNLVKQRYGAELRNKTLATIKPEISQALTSLLEELSSSEDARICRTQGYRSNPRSHPRRQNPSQKSNKYCCLCRAANRPEYNTHYLSQCRHLSPGDRAQFSSPNIRGVETYDDDETGPREDDEYDDDDFQDGDEREALTQANTRNNSLFVDPQPSVRRVMTRKSPRMRCFYTHIPLSLCIDTGAESNLIHEKSVRMMGLSPSPTRQGANQADMKTPLSVVGEITKVKINKGSHVFKLDALVVRDEIGDDIVAGEPFLYENDIAVRPARREIIIKGTQVVTYASQL